MSTSSLAAPRGAVRGLGSFGTLGLLVVLSLLSGCASGERADDGAQRRVVRFAVLPAPAMGLEKDRGFSGGAAWLDPLDQLLEAVTQLSAEPDLDFVLVPGPLLAALGEAGAEGPERSAEALRARPLLLDAREASDALLGGLGSLAARVYPALGPVDPNALAEELRGLPGHPGRAGYFGQAVAGLQPVVLGPGGELPAREDDAEAGGRALLVAVHAAPALAGDAARRVVFEVTSGEALLFAREGDRVRLVLPPMSRPPHLFALVEVRDGYASLSLRAAEPPDLAAELAIEVPPPVSLQGLGAP